MVYVDGWRGRIGLITVAAGSATEYEFNRYAPEGIAVLTTRVPLRDMSPEALIEMADHVEEAAALLAGAEVDIIAFACTAGSLVKGAGYDREIIERLQNRTGLPVTTTSTGVLEAFKALNVKKIVVTTPYKNAVNRAEKTYLEESGFTVLRLHGVESPEPRFVPQIFPEQMYRLTREAFMEDAEAIFISCTGLHVDTIIDLLEDDFQRPVITSNQATLWSALRKIGVNEQIQGMGRLFRL
ncbi:MAG: aspartate/glutamate racemase family protein [Pseudomonadota bacterium]